MPDNFNPLKKEKEDEYNRFMGYICSAQDGVAELNVHDHTVTKYGMSSGTLQKQTVSYKDFPFDLFHEEDRPRAHEIYDEDKLAELCRNQSATYAELRLKWGSSQEYRWCNIIVLGLPITKETPFSVLILLKDNNELKEQERTCYNFMYEQLFKQLKEMGADTDEALKRFGKDEEFYVHYLKMLKDEESMQALRDAVAAKDYAAAERAAHTLKGVALTLALLPLTDVCMDMLLDFRAKENEEGAKLLPKVEAQFKRFTDKIDEML